VGGLQEYRFADIWWLRAPTARVFAALTDLAAYPEWWSDVRAVRKIDEDTAEVVCRAALPYALTIRMRRAEQDEHAGRVGVHLSGDLEGVLVGTLAAHNGGTRLEISQEVVAHKRLLRALAPLARPLFLANHTIMMRRGHRGLSTHLA
jgi:uncharacterized protein YndB with AHSA1/START domain